MMRVKQAGMLIITILKKLTSLIQQDLEIVVPQLVITSHIKLVRFHNFRESKVSIEHNEPSELGYIQSEVIKRIDDPKVWFHVTC